MESFGKKRPFFGADMARLGSVAMPFDIVVPKAIDLKIIDAVFYNLFSL